MQNLWRRVSRPEFRQDLLARMQQGAIARPKAEALHSKFSRDPCAAAPAPTPDHSTMCGLRKEFDNRKGAKACSPEHLREYRRLHGHKYYLANREKWLERERLRRAKWSPKPRQCVVCGEDFVVANRKNSRANACPKHRHDRKLQMERARYHAQRGPRSSENRSISWARFNR